MILACLSRHNLGLDSCRWFSRWWLRPRRPPCVIEDLLDYVWVNDPKAAPSDDTHGAATQRAQLIGRCGVLPVAT
jgi:hypothetical protein